MRHRLIRPPRGALVTLVAGLASIIHLVGGFTVLCWALWLCGMAVLLLGYLWWYLSVLKEGPRQR